MRKIRFLAFTGYFLVLLLAINSEAARAQAKPFDFKNGDRVVFLGNSLFENDFQFGYLELALTTRFPDRDLTFRNLGWTGDNVWGEARSTFTNPPTPYEHLMQDITQAQPKVVILGYGGVEAQEGEAGLPRFREGLNKLLDKIDALGARAILLSPIPVMTSDTSVNLSKRNADLELYAKAIAQTAADRGKLFIDIYKPILDISKKTAIIENGVHLNETGYYYLARAIENGLGLPAAGEVTTITVSKKGAEISAGGKILEGDMSHLKFKVHESYLPLPLPAEGLGITEHARILKITGLKKGFYTLAADNSVVITASAQDWEKGVKISQGPSFEQAARLRAMILKKNDLHFFQYRPLNQTYILGFRSYEQGRHVKGLEEQNILIKWLEGQIALQRGVKDHLYQLTALK
ncbi:hypothetical protein DYBT9275_00090 [Dyadobacter sp. CECT 9275]|uniref:SGNH hydrolase-type esterase domain-containing protein n=1 Tax=Dyadobacter helix TaxID=2822344 RepID=A0A916J6R2_9BACT|nr:SGNH/GDSL hydrolase family protein [Dyadobacter sp. CECT 9275]CAG4988483.1 hypothetical protein DYBT9275_00090 [Dyadobacter sp. CECT 9275]